MQLAPNSSLNENTTRWAHTHTHTHTHRGTAVGRKGVTRSSSLGRKKHLSGCIGGGNSGLTGDLQGGLLMSLVTNGLEDRTKNVCTLEVKLRDFTSRYLPEERKQTGKISWHRDWIMISAWVNKDR